MRHDGRATDHDQADRNGCELPPKVRDGNVL
jgi:hypothetical protein